MFFNNNKELLANLQEREKKIELLEEDNQKLKQKIDALEKQNYALNEEALM